MKVSIVTVCFNSGKTIRDTIESVLSQTHSDLEYIIVDGASTDDTLGIVAQYRSRISRVISEPDEGLYDAMNKGVRVATGDVIGILNSDDVYQNDRAIEDVAHCFAGNPGCDVVYGDVVFVRPDALDKTVRFYSSAHFKPWKLRFGWMPPHPATFIRRSAYARIGPYSTSYRIAADYEWFVRALLKLELRSARIDQVLIRMRTGGTSAANLRNSLLLNREIVRACRENGIYTNLAMVLSKLPFKLIELIRRPA